MAKVITGDIQDLTIPWENYAGQSVEKFIKQELGSACGYIYRTSQKEGDYYYLYGFHSIDDFNEWMAGEPINPLFRVQLPNIENDVFAANLYTDSNTTKIVNLGDGVKINLRYTSTSTNPATQEVSDTYNDGTLIIMRSANGSAFSEVGRITISPIEHTQVTTYREIDITDYLADGDNEIRLRVVDNVNGSVSNNVNFKSIVNTTLRVSNATPITNPLTSPLFQYYVEGQIAKTLNIEITQNGNTDTYAIPMGTTTWVEAPYYAQLDGSYETGIIEVETWLSVDDTELESNHISNQFYFVDQPTSVDAIILNNIAPTAISYANTHFFDFVVFNAVSDVNITISDGNNTLLDYTFEDCSVNTLYSFYNSIQINSQSDYINATVTVSSAHDTETYPLVIDNREKMSPTAGADFVINPLRRSNTESNPGTIINDMTGSAVSATFNNFNFVNDGWVNGDNGIKVLRIPAGASLSVSYDPFVNLTRGTTIELDYKIYNVFDDDDVMINMSSETFDHKPLGFVMNATEAAFYTAENQTKRDQDVMFQENNRTHMVINIIPNLANSGLNYIRIFINGVMNREMIYSNSDIFKNGTVNMLFGSNHCDLDIFGIRVYKSGLSASDIRQDYMSSIPTLEEKLIFKNANDILAAGGTISYDKAVVKYNTLVWTGNHPEYRTGDQEYRGTLRVNIIGDPDHSGVMTNLRIKGQGSSSKGYWKWNHQYDWNKYDQDTIWTDGNGNTHTKGYTLTDDDPAATKLVAKLNWASSMQSHKIGSTALYTDLWREIVGGNSITATEEYEDARVSVHEKPFLYFIKETEVSAPVFAGLMTFGSGKFDKLTFGYNKNVFPDYLIIEGSDNGMPLTNRQVPWFDDEVTYNADEEYYEYAGQGNWDYGMGDKNMLSYFKNANNFVYLHSLRLLPYTDANELVNPSYQYWNTSTYNVVRFDHISGTWVNAGITKSDGQYSALNIATQTGVTPTGVAADDNELFKTWRKNDFKNHIAEYYNITDVLFSMALLKMIAASDNRCKNTYEYLDPVTHKICLAQDDMDTIMLTDNVGRKTKPYYVEEHDVNGEGQYYFNGEDNNFFTLMDEAYNVELRAMMKNILTEMASSKYGGSVESCLQRYYFDVQEYFPAVAYNETARLLYEEASVYQAAGTYTNGTKAISQSLGDQLQGEKQWWTRRLKYLQSWAGADPFYVRSTTGASLQFRSLLTTLGTNPTYQFDLTPWQWLYPKAGTGQVPGQDNTRVPAGDTYTTRPLTTDGNTDTFIYGADYYTSYGEFGDKPIGEAFPLVGQRLLEFSADSREVTTYEFRPRSMTVSCPVLRSLCLYGCSTVAGVLNLSSSTKLESVDLRGTGLQTVVLPETDTLTEVYLPALTSLTMNGCPNVSTLSLAGYNNLVSINTDNSDLALDVMENASNLNNITLNNINITTTSSNVDDVYAILADPDITCNITGDIYLAKRLSNSEMTAIEDKFGESVWNENNSLYISYIPTEITTVTIAASEKTIFQNDSVTISVTTDGNNVKSYDWSVDSTINLTTVEKRNSLVINSTTFNKMENITITYTIITTNNQTLTSSITISSYYLDIHIQDFSDSEHTVVRNDYSLRNAVIDLYAADAYSIAMDGFDFTGIVDDGSYIADEFSEGNFRGGFESHINIYYFVLFTGNIGQYKVYWKFHFWGTETVDVYVPFYINCLGFPEGATFDTVSDFTCYNGTGSTHISYTIPAGSTINSGSVSTIPSNKRTISNQTNTGFDLSINDITQSYSDVQALLIIGYPQLFGSGIVEVYSYSNKFAVNYVETGPTVTATYNITTTGSTDVLYSYSLQNITKMTVDGEEINTPQSSYNFDTTGDHVIEWNFAKGNDLGSAFYSIATLKSAVISGATQIGTDAFNGSGITSVTIPDTVTSIGNQAFKWCSKLTSITLPTSLTTIGQGVFYNCTGLTSITLPEGITTIGWQAFRGCTGLTSITLPDSLTNTGQEAFRGCTGLTSITIPSRVTSIGVMAFSGCTGLTSITLPDSLTNIGNSAFEDCAGLTSITIPSRVTSIGAGVFRGCTGLTSITLPDSLTNTGNSAFYGCTGLTSIALPTSLATIDYNTFYNCTGLTNITIPSSLYRIEYNAFQNCRGLTSITLPEGFAALGSGAFYNCTGLTSITLPSTLTSIKYDTFRGCTKLNSIIINRSTAPSLQSGAWGSDTGTAGYSSGTTNILYVPQDATGYDTDNWTAYLLNASYGKFTLSKTL